MTTKISPKVDVAKENDTKKGQLSENSAMCHLVGLILDLCPHCFLKEQLHDKLMYSLLGI